MQLSDTRPGCWPKQDGLQGLANRCLSRSLECAFRCDLFPWNPSRFARLMQLGGPALPPWGCTRRLCDRRRCGSSGCEEADLGRKSSAGQCSSGLRLPKSLLQIAQPESFGTGSRPQKPALPGRKDDLCPLAILAAQPFGNGADHTLSPGQSPQT